MLLSTPHPAGAAAGGGLVEARVIDLVKKLGIKPGDAVCCLDPPAETADELRAAISTAIHSASGSASPPEVAWYEALGQARYALILFWPRRLEGLAEQFARLQNEIRPAGAIWAIMPKKKFAKARGIDLTWEQLQAAGLQTDLVDNKIASLGEQDYGTRFVIRKDRRGKYS